MSSIRDFVPLAKLGEGTFSTVYKVRRMSDQEIYALKKVRLNSLSDKEKQNALNEIRILASFESEFIVGYKEAFFDDKLNVICIVMEFADGGDLQQLISNTKKDFQVIPEQKIWMLMKDILRALQSLHSKGILHRDLKSANIFIHHGRFKLGDLNVSKVNGGSLAYTQTGTPYYASPEVWRDAPYDSKSDIWSFGCILYELAALSPPFHGKDMDQLYQNVQKGSFKPIPSYYSQSLSSIISQCLRKNPNQRPSAIQMLKHPIFKQLNDLQNPKTLKTDAKNQLLRTIQLPKDLTSLKTNLPKPKYSEKRPAQSINHYKSDRSEYPYTIKNSRKGQEIQKMPSKLANPSRSEVFHSPKNVHKNQSSCLEGRSPEEFLSRKLYSAQSRSSKKPTLNLSERVQANYSERKPQILNNCLMEKYNKFIRQEICQKPHGIPRTEKRNNYISSQHQPTGPERIVIEQWKKKLVKKSRVMSNNTNIYRPS